MLTDSSINSLHTDCICKQYRAALTRAVAIKETRRNLVSISRRFSKKFSRLVVTLLLDYSAPSLLSVFISPSSVCVCGVMSFSHIASAALLLAVGVLQASAQGKGCRVRTFRHCFSTVHVCVLTVQCAVHVYCAL